MVQKVLNNSGRQQRHTRMTMPADDYPDHCFTNTGDRQGLFLPIAAPEFITQLYRNLKAGMSFKSAVSLAGISYQHGMNCRRKGRAIIDKLNADNIDVDEWMQDANSCNTEKAYVRIALTVDKAEADGQTMLVNAVTMAALGDGKLALDFLKSRFPKEYSNGRNVNTSEGTIEVRVNPDEIADRLRDILGE